MSVEIVIENPETGERRKHLAPGPMLPAPWRVKEVVQKKLITHPVQPLSDYQKLDSELSEAGIKWGDAIAWVTKKIGIKQCPPCKARQEILNSASKLGWKETIRQIKATYA